MSLIELNSSESADVAAVDAIADYRALFSLAGRRYVVLGGGQGMGRQVAHAISQLGGRVVVVDIDAARAEQVAGEIGGDVASFAIDATDDAAVANLAAEVAQRGPIDGVVDVIGVARYRTLVLTTVEDWEFEHDIVLKHAWLALRHFAPLLTAAGHASVTFVASVSGLGSAPMHGAYGVFKAGLASLVRTAAVELGPRGVRVNAIAPGFVLTPRMAESMTVEQVDRARSATPLPRLILPADVAAGLAFLVSDLAASMTGQVMVVDAGATVSYPYDMSGFGA